MVIFSGGFSSSLESSLCHGVLRGLIPTAMQCSPFAFPLWLKGQGPAAAALGSLPTLQAGLGAVCPGKGAHLTPWLQPSPLSSSPPPGWGCPGALCCHLQWERVSSLHVKALTPEAVTQALAIQLQHQR